MPFSLKNCVYNGQEDAICGVWGQSGNIFASNDRNQLFVSSGVHRSTCIDTLPTIIGIDGKFVIACSRY